MHAVFDIGRRRGARACYQRRRLLQAQRARRRQDGVHEARRPSRPTPEIDRLSRLQVTEDAQQARRARLEHRGQQGQPISGGSPVAECVVLAAGGGAGDDRGLWGLGRGGRAPGSFMAFFAVPPAGASFSLVTTKKGAVGGRLSRCYGAGFRSR